MDFANTHEQAMRGNTGASALYAASALAGVGAALLFGGALCAAIFGFSASGVGLILVAIGIAIALLIELFKTNELQDWLERCLFGDLREQRYPDLEEEMEQFELALKALGFKSEEEEVPAAAIPAN